MSATDGTATGVDEVSLRSLRRWNLGLTVLHFGQAVAVLALSTDFAITVTKSLPEGPPGTPPGQPEALFDLPIGVAVAVFLGARGASTTCSPRPFSGAPTRTTSAPGSTGSGGWSTRSAPLSWCC